ncbi:hypothetical protein [Thiocapsa marina]|uniref:Uncharacterized protein n=1 Tax=Thiocapsa marina 5811 TaxID=768671 RepID=F9UHP7_9GAMM|nr:hypothetical protein [Thiocapsa marina]EGV16223.1 hypothetical protein ThimaDRAFT_4450 [Thiocapsa marina 5811]
MNLLEKLLDNQQSERPSADTAQASAIAASGDYFDNIFEIAYWENHMVNTIGPQLDEVPLARRAEIFPLGYRAFVSGRDGIVESMRRTAETGEMEVALFHALGSSFVFLVTGLPWATRDVTNLLERSAGKAAFGYGAFLNSALMLMKPGNGVTHWLQISLTMGDGRFHLAAGEYNRAGGWAAFCHPAQLCGAEDEVYFKGSTPLVAIEL